MAQWLDGSDVQTERMFVYNYRIYDRYRRPVVSLAVLGDEEPAWRPNEFSYGMFGCTMGIRFPVVKLLDYARPPPTRLRL